MFISKLKKSEFAQVLIFSFAALAMYAWTINSPFIFDDNYNILLNNFIKDLGYFTQYFTNPRTHNGIPENAPYRPLLTTVYALLWAVGNGSTVPFHIYKILIHILAGWFAFKIYKKTLVRSSADPRLIELAWIGTLFFLIHPANAETVNYISSASTLQCSVFYLGAFLFYLDKKYFLMVLFFLGSVFTKEEGATFPAMLVLYQLILGGGRINKIAVGLASAALAFYLAVYVNLPKTVHFSNVDSLSYLFTQFRAWAKYLIWIFVPTDFAIEHTGFGFSKTFWETTVVASFALSLILIGASLFVLWRYRGRLSLEAKTFIFGLLSFYLVMMPTSSIFALSEPINEHRYYLSFAFLFPSFLIFLHKLPLNKKIAGLIISVVIAILSVLTLQQAKIWKTQKSVWENAVKIDPTNPRAFLNLGVQFLEEGHFDQAIEHFERCRELAFHYPLCSLNIGIALAAKGEIAKADASYAEAVEWGPQSLVAAYRYGEFLIESKRDYAKGLQMLKACEELSQGDTDRCLKGKSMALRELGRLNESLEAARRMLQLNPGQRIYQFEVGLTLISLNQLDEAYDVFEQILQQNPGDLQSLHNLAWIELRRKNWAHSIELWRKKLAAYPEDLVPWLHLKFIAEQTKDKALLEEVRNKVKP